MTVPMKRKPFACDVCGCLISLYDLDNDIATRRVITPSSDHSRAEVETLCFRHREPERKS